MKKLLITFFLTFLFLSITSNLISQKENNKDLEDDFVEQSITVAALIDGAIKNLESAGTNNLMSTGLVGFSRDNQRLYIKLVVSAFSSFDSINSNKSIDYAKNILNTGVTNSSLSSISFEMHQRFFSKQGFQFYAARNEYLSKKITPSRTGKFHELLNRNDLHDLNWFRKYIGYKITGEISNSVWSNKSLPSPTNVSIGSLSIGLTYYKQLSNKESFDISFYTGVGITSRFLFNDISQDIYENQREEIIGNSSLYYFGPEIFAGLNINNLYAKFNFPFFLKDKSVNGLTNGQPIFSVGIIANIGYNDIQTSTIQNLGNRNESKNQ